MPRDPAVARQAIIAAVKNGTLSRDRLDEAVARVSSLMTLQERRAKAADATTADRASADPTASANYARALRRIGRHRVGRVVHRASWARASRSTGAGRPSGRPSPMRWPATASRRAEARPSASSARRRARAAPTSWWRWTARGGCRVDRERLCGALRSLARGARGLGGRAGGRRCSRHGQWAVPWMPRACRGCVTFLAG